MSKTLVSLKNAGVKRADRWLVRNLDLSVSAGEIVTLIGPNGSGKSTTAKLALGIFKPSEGQVTSTPGIRIAYVPQKLLIDQTLPLSVKRFMSLTMSLTTEQTEDALEMVGALHLIKAQVQALSGGEFQRVLLARAIARSPDLLVLDEPVQGVDFAGEIALYELISEIRDKLGCGILLISHDLHLVMAATDTVVCLNGHVCCRGTAKAVAASPEYREIFGARAADALAVYAHHHDHVHLPDGRVQHEDGSVTDHCGHEEHEHHNDHEPK